MPIYFLKPHLPVAKFSQYFLFFSFNKFWNVPIDKLYALPSQWGKISNPTLSWGIVWDMPFYRHNRHRTITAKSTLSSMFYPHLLIFFTWWYMLVLFTLLYIELNLCMVGLQHVNKFDVTIDVLQVGGILCQCCLTSHQRRT